jgi:hypothetical protein
MLALALNDIAALRRNLAGACCQTFDLVAGKRLEITQTSHDLGYLVAIEREGLHDFIAFGWPGQEPDTAFPFPIQEACHATFDY